jgi:hypothetical protein
MASFPVAYGDMRPEGNHDAHRPERLAGLWFREPVKDGPRVDVDGYGLRDGGYAVFMHVVAGGRHSYHFVRRVPTFKGLERVIGRFGTLVQANTVTWRTDYTAPAIYRDLVPDYRGD